MTYRKASKLATFTASAALVCTALLGGSQAAQAAYEPLTIITGTVKAVEAAQDGTRGIFVTFVIDGEENAAVPQSVLEIFAGGPDAHCPAVEDTVWNYHLMPPGTDLDGPEHDLPQFVYDQSLNALNIAVATGIKAKLLLPKPSDISACTWNRIEIRGVRIDADL